MAEIATQLRSLSQESFKSEHDRQVVLAEAQALVNRLETPWETGFRYSWVHPTRMACLRTAMDLDLFGKWKAAGAAPKTLDEIAELVTCDRVLLSRIICHLAATQILQITEPGIFGLTPFALALAEPLVASAVEMYSEVNGPALLNLPTFLASTSYQNPTDSVDNNLKHWAGAPIWEWLKSQPKAQAVIDTAMTGKSANRPSLAEVFPVDEMLKRATDDTVLLVDCGGGLGHDTAAFAKAYPQKPGKLVLQDRQVVVKGTGSLDPAIRVMEYDFFTPQPIKGAAAYYLHCVLHDWPDSDCRKILDQQKSSMKKGYSKLLIHEVVLDPAAPESAGTTSDIVMMGLASAMERTADQWRSLLDSAGFKIIAIHNKPFTAESVIEAEMM